MRKLLYAAALLSAGALLWGCRNQIQGDPVNHYTDPAVVDPIVKVKTLGAYSVEGKDYAYKKGEWQISRSYSQDGRSLSFSLLDPAGGYAYNISGVKTVAQKGQSYYVTFTARDASEVKTTFASSAKVVEVSGDTLWLKSSSDAYYVIKK